MTGPATGDHTQEIQELEGVANELRAEDAAKAQATGGGAGSPSTGVVGEITPATSTGTTAEAAAGTSTDPKDKVASQSSASDGGLSQQSSSAAPASTDSGTASSGTPSGAESSAGAASSTSTSGAPAATGTGTDAPLPEGDPAHLGDVGAVGAIGAAGPQHEAAGLTTEPAAATTPFDGVIATLTTARDDAAKVQDPKAATVATAIDAAISAAKA